MSQSKAFIQGCQSAVPIMLGYIPVGIAFGLACASAGLPAWAALAMSVFIYAGASQFLLLASITGGASVGVVVALCALLDSRHLLYAPLITRHLKPNQNITLPAILMTDEVFATALSKLDDIKHQQAWFWGISLVAWATWWLSTLIGIYSGQALSAYPLMQEVMNFAFVALFVSLATHAYHTQPSHRPAIVIGAIIAMLCVITGHANIAILSAAIVAFMYCLFCPRQPKS